jgi:hypothetical protein
LSFDGLRNVRVEMSCLYFRGLGLGLTDDFNPLHATVSIALNVIKIESNPGAHFRIIGALLGRPFGVLVRFAWLTRAVG